MKNTLICDLDGTLALDDHRRPLIATKGWEAYFNACPDDVLNYPVAFFLGMWHQWSGHHKTVILTGRCESQREATTKWLHDRGIDYDRLLMRPQDSYDPKGTASDGSGGHWTSDQQVKLAMIQQLGLSPENVFCCLDDRDCMVEFWRGLGFDCWQVRPGAF